MVNDFYLYKHPKLMKWMNVCVGCNDIGYKPERPDEIYSGKYQNQYVNQLKLYYKPLAVNEFGLCEACQLRMKK